MSIVEAVKASLGAKVALRLAGLVLALTVVAAVVIISHETRQMEELTLEKARVVAASAARQYGEVLEGAIDDGALTVQDVFDRNYVEIRGYDWGGNPKYHTRYDAVTDRAVLVFQDQLLSYGDFPFAVGADENGYVPTHNTVYQRALTGDLSKDPSANRTKRIYSDPVSLTATRSLEPSLLQAYKRDSGEIMWDVSSPIYVKGKHWGAFRLGVSMERISQRKNALLLVLAGIFALFGVFIVGTIYLVLRNAMGPVVALTATAERISMGEELDTAIKPRSTDEIGRLTKSIDRLRTSMKAAMARLGH